MKTQYILSILAATAIFAGCAKENASEDIPELGENQFFATMEDGAKTILNRDGENKNKIFWEETDEVRINGSLFTVEPYLADNRKAVFTLKSGQTAPSGLPYVAYYPSSIVSGSTLTLPSTINYTAANPFRGVFPMYAVSAGSRNLLFRNVCGLLEIKLTGTDKILSLTVTDESKSLSGPFTINEDHEAELVTPTGTAGVTINFGTGVQLSSTPTVVYVPVPKGTYTKLTVSATFDGEKEWSANAKATAQVGRNNVYSIDFAVSPEQPALPGEFSVSASELVHFSQGNLYCTDNGESASPRYTFGFEEKQYDFRLRSAAGKNSMKNGATYTVPENESGMFQWNKDNAVSGNDYGAFTTAGELSGENSDHIDWGETISDKWTTLDTEQWNYLVARKSSTGKSLISWAVVGGIPGLALAPDNYSGFDSDYFECTLSQWQSYESDGLVFLPGCGELSGGRQLSMYGGSYYSTSDPDRTRSQNANVLCASYDSNNSVLSVNVDGASRSSAHPVRLAQLEASHDVRYTITAKVAAGCEEMGTVSGGGNYPQGATATLTATPNPGYKFVEWNDGVTDATRQVTVTADATFEATFEKSPVLPGEFSVSATKKVHFSCGNLWYGPLTSGAASTFNFEDNQWKSIPTSNGTWDASHVSHFYWSTDSKDAVEEEYNEFTFISDTDVFFTNETTTTANPNFIVNGVTGQFRTLSTAEWQYLFSNHSYKWATVNGVGGYVIAPDNFTGTLQETYANDAALAEAGNLVFLPAAGRRNYSYVFYVGVNGFYWSSTAFGSLGAYNVIFDSDNVHPDEYGAPDDGSSVRLIIESK